MKKKRMAKGYLRKLSQKACARRSETQLVIRCLSRRSVMAWKEAGRWSTSTIPSSCLDQLLTRVRLIPNQLGEKKMQTKMLRRIKARRTTRTILTFTCGRLWTKLKFRSLLEHLNQRACSRASSMISRARLRTCSLTQRGGKKPTRSDLLVERRLPASTLR